MVTGEVSFSDPFLFLDFFFGFCLGWRVSRLVAFVLPNTLRPPPGFVMIDDENPPAPRIRRNTTAQAKSNRFYSLLSGTTNGVDLIRRPWVALFSFSPRPMVKSNRTF